MTTDTTDRSDPTANLDGLTRLWQSTLAADGPAADRTLASARHWLETQQRLIAAGQECHEELARFTTARFEDYAATLTAMRRCDNVWDLTTASNEFMARTFKAYADEARVLASLATPHIDTEQGSERT